MGPRQATGPGLSRRPRLATTASRWIADQDFDDMETTTGSTASANPPGFWLNESPVRRGEYYPRGGEGHLRRVCEMMTCDDIWASHRNVYVYWWTFRSARGNERCPNLLRDNSLAFS
ncbi:hypothetical protein F4818DRAFT_439076 [Hypoxylon cercidicola]|nr:hypothetical protein F4818DRAFT_439076 [Hypoxylon cercidicola]